MVMYQIKEKHWEQVNQHIMTHGRAVPLSKQIDLDMTFNGMPYIVRIQPEKKHKIVILQAISVCTHGQRSYENEYSLIVDNTMLGAFFKIFLYQITQGHTQHTH